jgi:RNA polymerase sigma-70 factor (ECF subfamily)
MDFEAICLPLRAEAVKYAMRMTMSRDHAEDIVQDAYIRAFNAWDRWTPDHGDDPQRSAKAWLFRIVTNVFLNEYKTTRNYRVKRQNNAAEIICSTYNVPRGDTPASYLPEVAPEHSTSDEVASALESLSDAHREVIKRSLIDGQTYGEIAMALGIAEGTVMSRAYRARALLEPLLRRHARDQWGMSGAVDAGKHACASKPLAVPEANTDRVKRVVAEDNAGALSVAQARPYAGPTRRRKRVA